MKAAIAALAVVSGSTCLADELAERAMIEDLAASAFMESDFDALERQAEEYRTRKAKTSSGTWKLPYFYVGLATDGLKFKKDQSAEWSEAMKKFDLWIEKYPQSPTPYVAQGEALMRRGWTFRGTGWAKGVAEADMRAYLDLAIGTISFLLEHEEIGSRDPHWYRTLADAFNAVGVDKEQFVDLIVSGLDRYPDYDELYFAAAGSLSPKWGGSAAAVEKFARAALARTKDRGYEIYARIYWAAGLQGDGRYLFQYPEADWSDIVRGMDDVLERYPTQWNISHFAFFACYKFDQATTRRYLELVEEPIVERAWGPPINYQKCRLNAGLPPSPNFPIPEPDRKPPRSR
jgi:hypothetical protein